MGTFPSVEDVGISFIIQEEKEESKEDGYPIKVPSPTMKVDPSSIDFTKNIKLTLELEKQKMIANSSKQGISEETINKLLEE